MIAIEVEGGRELGGTEWTSVRRYSWQFYRITHVSFVAYRFKAQRRVGIKLTPQKKCRMKMIRTRLFSPAGVEYMLLKGTFSPSTVRTGRSAILSNTAFVGEAFETLRSPLKS